MGKLSTLLIPRKGVKEPSEPVSTADHDTNMRAIEMWAQNVGSGDIIEITSVDHTVIITNPKGPIVDLSAASSGGGYLSLTGPGQTSTPGDLTQLGDFTIDGQTSAGLTVNGDTNLNGSLIVLDTMGNIEITQSGTGLLKILNNNSSGSSGIEIESTDAGIVIIGPASNIEQFTNGSIQLQAGGTVGEISLTTSVAGASVGMSTASGTASISSGASGGVQIQGATGGDLGFFGSSGTARPTITGSRGGNAGLASLLTALDNMNLIHDTTTP